MSKNIEFNTKIVLLPVAYFFLSSITLISAATYLLTHNKGISSSYASSGDELNFNIVSKNEAYFVPQDPEELLCETDITKKIDAYFKNKKAPLAGFGCEMVKAGQEFEVNPVLIAAIAQKESQGGKVTPQFQNQESYNAWGWGVLDNNSSTKALDAYSCDTFTHCINRVTSGIAKKSKTLGTEPTAENVVKWYNPGSINRAGGIVANSEWLVGVNTIMAMIEKTEVE